MVVYAAVLISTGANVSAFYFAAIILASAAMLVYYSVSMIRTENTIELLAAVALGTCVSASVFYFRANDNAFAAVKRRSTVEIGISLPSEVIDVGVVVWQSLVQLALMGFGYVSHRDFGWRIFKLFGIDFHMRQVRPLDHQSHACTGATLTSAPFPSGTASLDRALSFA